MTKPPEPRKDDTRETMLRLVPIHQTAEENTEFLQHALCQDSLFMCMEFYKQVGFELPWICYYARRDDELVGSAGFKGKPKNGSVEIAYGTFEPYRKQDVGTKICRLLTELALRTDPDVRITARTLPENNYSTRILQKNHFRFSGMVNDP